MGLGFGGGLEWPIGGHEKQPGVSCWGVLCWEESRAEWFLTRAAFQKILFPRWDIHGAPNIVAHATGESEAAQL